MDVAVMPPMGECRCGDRGGHCKDRSRRKKSDKKSDIDALPKVAGIKPLFGTKVP